MWLVRYFRISRNARKISRIKRKKIGLPAVQVGTKATTLAGGRTYFSYSMSDFLQDDNGVFAEMFSGDVYNRFCQSEAKNSTTLNKEQILNRMYLGNE